MKSLLKSLLFVFVFGTLVCGQDLSSSQNLNELNSLHLKDEGLKTSIRELEDRMDTLVENLSKISEKDKAEAIKLKAEVERLFPCCPLADEEHETFGLSSAYSFRTEKTVDGYYGVSLFYEDGQFNFSDQFGNHGFIIDIGKTPLENVSEKLPQFAALNKYQPPFEIENVKKEFVTDKITFHQSTPVKIGNTYLLRAVSYAEDGNIDSIYALKVQRQDADGSIIVFFKKLKDFPWPKIKEKQKYNSADIYEAGMVIKIHGILREQGLNDVRVEFVERNLMVKGSVPKGKMAEVIKLLKELDPTSEIKNELIEK